MCAYTHMDTHTSSFGITKQDKLIEPVIVQPAPPYGP